MLPNSYQFPGFDMLPQSYKMSPLGETGFKGFCKLFSQCPIICNNFKIKSLQTCIMKIKKNFWRPLVGLLKLKLSKTYFFLQALPKCL